MPEAGLEAPPTWRGPSTDPNDAQFGDAVETVVPDDADEYDAVLLGEPYDGAVIGRRGAAEGPAAIREALAGVKTHHFEAGPVAAGDESGAGLRVADVGDVVPPQGGVAETQAAVAGVTERLHESDAVPVFLGGDNSLTVANVRPLLDRGRVGVVNFDAHLDVREVDGTPTSGTPYRQLHEAGLDTYVCVGARHFETSSAYVTYVEDRGGTVLTAADVAADPDAARDRIASALSGLDALYVSVDCDVLDASEAPGVSAPTPGGLAARELFEMVRWLGSVDGVAGFEVVECAPPLDPTPTGVTAAAAARTLAHFLAGLIDGGVGA